ncbi:Peroxin-1 [Aphelenchoides bicaudatus]|nr:Peroxin-1 [Aphelenchoides bicaudatus]
MAILVKIQEHKLPNCIGYLSDSPSTFPQSNSCGIFHCSGIESSSSRKCFALQVYGNRPPFYYLHLNRVFIERQGFKVEDQIILTPVENVVTCQWMEIVPESYNDWNIIESTSCIIEEIFLQQIRVFQPGMVFILHLSQGITASLRVAQLMPKITDGSAVLANNSTQVLVAPINNPSTSKNQRPVDGKATSNISESAGFRDPIASFLCQKSVCTPKFMRVLPKSLINIDDFHLPCHTLISISQEDASYLKAELIQIEGSDLTGPSVATLILLPKNGNALTGNWKQLFESLQNESVDSCWPSDDLRSLGLNCFTRLKCRKLKRKNVRKVTSLNYSCSIKTSPEIVRKSLLEYYQNDLIYMPCLLPNNEVLLKLSYGVEPKNFYFVRLSSDQIQNQPNSCGYFWTDSFPQLKDDGNTLKLRTESETKRSSIPDNFAQTQSNEILVFDFQKAVCNNFIDSLKTRLKLATDLSMGHLLITGASFGGKSTLMQLIANLLFDELRIFATRIDCNEFKGKSPDSIKNLLDARLKLLKTRTPSLLLLDNLDFLNSQVEDEDRRRFISKTYSKIARLITDSRIQVIASASSRASLPSDLINFNGQQFFTDFLEISPMKKEDYVEVFNKLFDVNIADSNDLLRKLERLNLGEVIKLCDRLRLTHRSNEEIKLESISETIDGLPSSSRSKKPVQNETNVSFKEVGGYEATKQQLREVFLWPIQHPQVYKSIGIGIGNGAILHGPSGCGKTLIARALATELNLNVIHVKGPELLSKYIGASEENVRKTFERARQSKPSLIIFDEFDSLVPKRGHDNTGVTDRVVNQFLTELDGVDSSMDGVYVLAATNRLDLIDVALLRPGRFDHKIFIGPPSKEERLEILRLQCLDVRLENDEDLEKVAELTENWSGAELRGVIVNALFEASRDNSTEEQPVITTQALQNSFKSTNESKTRTSIDKKTIKGPRVSLA